MLDKTKLTPEDIAKGIRYRTKDGIGVGQMTVYTFPSSKENDLYLRDKSNLDPFEWGKLKGIDVKKHVLSNEEADKQDEEMADYLKAEKLRKETQ